MNKSESIKQLAIAFNLAQAKMRGAVKDASNPFYKSKYADLGSVWEAVRVPLHENGLSVSQLTGQTASGDPVIETLLMHNSGEWLMGQFPLIAKDTSAQSMGSAVTYARRYALAALCSLPQVDDDGHAATVPSEPHDSQNSSSSAQTVTPTNRDKDPRGNNFISEKQMWRFFAIAKKHGFDRAGASNWLKAVFHVGDPSKILVNQYELICHKLESITASPQDNEPPPISGDDLPF